MLKEEAASNTAPTQSISFSMKAQQEYVFILSGREEIDQSDLSLINQKEGYSKSIYLLSVFLALFMIVTFLMTNERVKPPVDQKKDLAKDFKQLLNNRPWLVLLVIGLLFNIYTSIKMGIIVIYFLHYLNNELFGL